MKKQYKSTGSALLTVIALLAVLVIIATSLMQGKSKRAYFTRYMSNEKKAEAIAEAALDMAMSAIRAEGAKKANDPTSGHPVYGLLRTPIPFSGNFSDGSQNTILETPDDEQEIDSSAYLDAIQTMDDNIGTIKELKITARISHAEAFGDSEQADYKVVGINEKINRPSKNFPPSSASPASNRWRVPLYFPNGSNTPTSGTITDSTTPAYEKEVIVDLECSGFGLNELVEGFIGDEIKVLLKFFRVKENTSTNTTGSMSMLKFLVNAENSFLDTVNKLLNFIGKDGLTNEILNQKIAESDTFKDCMIDVESKLLKMKYFEGLDTFTIPGLQQFVMGESASVNGYAEPPESSYGNIVEKGGLLQLKCELTYLPEQGKVTGEIKKILVAEVPFKLSDVQPIAPEHTFFIANSKSLDETNLAGAGQTISLDEGAPESTAFNVENALVIHNLPGMTAETDKPKYSSLSAEQPAGRVRINGTVKEINTFVGALGQEQIKFTELNTVCPFEKTPTDGALETFLKVWLTFGVTPENNANNTGKINFPVLFNKSTTGTKTITGGVMNITKIYADGSIGDIFTMPTLLQGYAHMEYPLGRKIEASLKANVSELYAILAPDITINVINGDDIELKPDDNSVVYYEVKRKCKSIDGKDIWYGMPEIDESNNEENEWRDDAPKNMPPYCYSTTQYMKKASKFFDSQSDFNEALNTEYIKGGFKDTSGSIRVDGVTFIKGDLKLEGMTYVGHGLIVCDRDVTISGSIKADDDSSLGIIARRGTINAQNVEMIKASLFSNQSPILNEVFISGNLVINGFSRDNFKNVHVAYAPDTTYCDTSYLSGGGDLQDSPHRYHASFADNWLRTYYEKAE